MSETAGTGNPELAKVLAEAAKTRQNYENDEKQKSFNLLLLGESGGGKTTFADSCRQPVHIDSFDPGGTKGLRKSIKEGRIIVDSRFESENPITPSAYKLWKEVFDHRKRIGYFDHIGTYFLDSSTMWSYAIMNWVLQKDGIAGQAPRFTKDYGPQKIEIRNRLQLCLDLPCDFVLTGHLESEKDEVEGKMKYKFMTTGKGDITIPLLFDEIWTMLAESKGREVSYQLLTKKNGAYPGATRIGRDKFDTFETPDMKLLLKKAGWPCNDKPLLKAHTQ